MSTPVDPTPSTPGVPAGWYPDATTGRTRWWDGTQWTDQFAPPPSAPVGYAPYGYAPAPVSTGNGIAVAAFVLGLVAIVVRVPLLGYWGFDVIGLVLLAVPTILAVVFGAVGIARARSTGKRMPFAITGLVLGGVAILWTLATFLGVFRGF